MLHVRIRAGAAREGGSYRDRRDGSLKLEPRRRRHFEP
jgi:hypothetical protein